MGVTVCEADVPHGVYDQHRRVVVLPLGLSLAEKAAAVRELFAERRADAVPEEASLGPLAG